VSAERPTAVFLDALGTLVQLEPPAPRLRRLLAQAGFEVTEERAARGFAAEIAYYLEHHLEGSDRERLASLRDRCAAALREALDLPGLDQANARKVMLGALEFTPYPEVLDSLRVMRHHGHLLVIVSNWDCSLSDWLGPAGLIELVDGVVSSAEVGAAKPDPAVFERALQLADVSPARAVHVGDALVNDVEGARAAGVRGILVQREGEPPSGVEVVRSLAEVPGLL
jgi:putative hydrolase of the HAD superfamily